MFLNSYILCGVAVVVTLVAMWAGQSRLHWFWRGCILEGVLALFLPVKAQEPLLFFLVSTPLIAGGVAWLERRRPRKPVAPGNEPAPPQKTARQFSLAEAFLLVALIGGIFGLGSAAVRAGVVMDWRSLPISALMFTSVALLCYRIAAFPGGIDARFFSFGHARHPVFAGGEKIPHYWALALTGLLGGGILLWYGTGSLEYLMPRHGPYLQSMVFVWAASLLIAGVCYLILRFGNPGYIIALAGVIFVAVRVERDFLQDWMNVADLLLQRSFPAGRAADIVILTLGYALFALGAILCVAIHHLAFSASTSLWKKYLARGAGLCVAAAGVYWLGGVHVKMFSTTPFPSVADGGENPLENALPLLDEFFVLDDPEEGFDPRNTPKAVKRHNTGEPIARVYGQLVQQLQEPAWAPFDASRGNGPESRLSQEAILIKLRTFSGVLTADIEQEVKTKDYDGAIPFIMAQLQMEDSLQHQGLVMHRWADNSTLLRLGAIRDRISRSTARQVLADLRRMERDAEPIEVTVQRERAWEERALNWRARLRRISNQDAVMLSGGRRFYYPLRTIVLWDQTRHTILRLLVTELALREFREEKGHYPGALKELTPIYLDTVPQDPSTNKPLTYQPVDEKYSLYGFWGEDLDAVIERHRLTAAKAAAAMKAFNSPPNTSASPPKVDESASPEE